MKIYISGLYSGTNPQPGVGLARSLREAYPNATLIGIEYSNRCSGIHWKDFDDIVLHRPWSELNLELHAKYIASILDSDAFYLSSNDLEIIWLATLYPQGHVNLLTPPALALKQTAKPSITAHETLPVKIPPFVSTELPDWELHAFCREHDWKVWLKGPYYEALRIRSWADFQQMQGMLSKAWSTEKLFLQAHVTGYEESICLSAYHGELINAVKMRKRDLTELSKTWSGDVTPISDEVAQQLRLTIKELNWTGGAEFEMVRDADEQLWLLEVNPRYPAWIHGATITGTNLVGQLLEKASGIPAKTTATVEQEFTRVVLEIPVRKGYPLPALPEPFAGGIGHSLKHPSGLLGFAQRLHKQDREAENQETSPKNQSYDSAAEINLPELVSDLDTKDLKTPSFVFLEKQAHQRFERASNLAKKLSSDKIQFTYAYSVKTNPDERLLRIARENGFMAETISPLEIKKALELGFEPNQIIVNGPGKWWQKEHLPKQNVHAIFADSLNDLKRIAASLHNGEIAN